MGEVEQLVPQMWLPSPWDSTLARRPEPGLVRHLSVPAPIYTVDTNSDVFNPGSAARAVSGPEARAARRGSARGARLQCAGTRCLSNTGIAKVRVACFRLLPSWLLGRVCACGLSQMATACRQPYGVSVRQIADTPRALRLQAQGGVARTTFGSTRRVALGLLKASFIPSKTS